MVKITKQKAAELRSGPARKVTEHNKRVQKNAPDNECGGCFGSGTGANCCVCGKPR